MQKLNFSCLGRTIKFADIQYKKRTHFKFEFVPIIPERKLIYVDFLVLFNWLNLQHKSRESVENWCLQAPLYFKVFVNAICYWSMGRQGKNVFSFME